MFVRLKPTLLNKDGQPQHLLSIKALQVLAELLHAYHQRGLSFQEKLLFRPSEIIKGQGLALSGTAYKELGQTLGELGRFMVQIGERGENDPLLNFVRTPYETLMDGQTFDIGQTFQGNGEIYWQIRLGKTLGLLHQRSDQFMTFPRLLLKEVGRSPSTQWLALHSFRHGFNGGLFYDYKLETLAKQSHLDCYIAQHQSKRSKLFQMVSGEQKVELARRLIQKTLKQGCQRLKKAAEQLHQVGLFQQITALGAQAPEEMRIKTRRLPATAETWLARIPRPKRLSIRSGQAGAWSLIYALLIKPKEVVMHPVSAIQPFSRPLLLT